jgi:hypothetical protein
VQPDVVERQLEGLLRVGEERLDPVRDLERRLAAVGQRVDVDQGRYRTMQFRPNTRSRVRAVDPSGTGNRRLSTSLIRL